MSDHSRAPVHDLVAVGTEANLIAGAVARAVQLVDPIRPFGVRARRAQLVQLILIFGVEFGGSVHGRSPPFQSTYRNSFALYSARHSAAVPWLRISATAAARSGSAGSRPNAR